MSNPLSVRRIQVQTIGPDGAPDGEPSYGIVASYNETTIFSDEWETLATLEKEIEDAESILGALDPFGETFPLANHEVIVKDNYYGTEWMREDTDE